VRELLLSDSFRKYRRRQVEAVCDAVHVFELRDNEDAMQLKGALEMARILIRLPEKLLPKPDEQEQIQLDVIEDIKAVEIGILRKHLMGKEAD